MSEHDGPSNIFKIKYLAPDMESGRRYGQQSRRIVDMINQALDAGKREIRLEVWPAEELNQANERVAKLEEAVKVLSEMGEFYNEKINWKPNLISGYAPAVIDAGKYARFALKKADEIMK